MGSPDDERTKDLNEIVANEVESGRSSLAITVTVSQDSLPLNDLTYFGDDRRSDISSEAIGPTKSSQFELLRVIGEGGMGTVYLAQQSEPVKRQVALKLIKCGMDSKAVLARFDAERQALAMMDHPNIARIIDGGTTANGEPFFVMEYVQGVPITQYCDEKRLTPEARLHLFSQVISAVHHAHQKGIIHRDLKPSNLLVTEIDGQPTCKVIDFGIAKATGSLLSQQSYGDTGAIVGTPKYMSPEQADPTSMDIDTRTDVYALGVVLYELITGATPLDTESKQLSLLELLRMIREVDAPRPSRKLSTSPAITQVAEARSVESSHLLKWLRRDFDWIVVKALEKDRDRRYESVSAFGADIQRLLTNEAVTACPPTRNYRIRKFVRRNRGAVIATGLLALAMLGGIIGTTLGMIEARKQRDIAEKEFRFARNAVDDYFVTVSEEELLNVPGLQPVRKKLLETAQVYYRKFLDEHSDDSGLKEDIASSQTRLAVISDELDQQIEALDLFRSAANLYGQLAESEPKVWRFRLNQAINRDREGTLLLSLSGQLDNAEKALTQSNQLFESLAESHPDEIAVQSLLAGSYGNLASLYARRGDMKKALELTVSSLEKRKALRKQHPDDVKLLEEIALTEHQLSLLQRQAGRDQEAGESLARTVKIYEQILEKKPESIKIRYHFGRSLGNEGRFAFEMGDNRSARGPIERSLVILEGLVRENPGVGEYRSALAAAHNMMSDVERASGNIAEAGKHAKAAKDLLVALLAESPANLTYLASLSKAWNVMGRTAAASGRKDEAIAAFRQSVEILKSLRDPLLSERYNLACNEALIVPLLDSDERAGQVGRTMAAIRAAYDAGFDNLAYYQRDSDFDGIRNEPEFVDFIKSKSRP